MNIKDWLLKEEKEEVFLVSDISKHGCSGGVCGIIYYNETVRFHDEHEKEIWDLLYEYAQNEGLKLVDKIAQIFKQVETDAGSRCVFKIYLDMLRLKREREFRYATTIAWRSIPT